MILQFPTGSKSIPAGEALGALIFNQDGSWGFRPHPDADEDDLHNAREFVDFMAYSLADKEHIKLFRADQDRSESEKKAEWRRENIKLVHSQTGSK